MAKVGRNAPCACGSGKKYKKCCLGSEESPVLPNPEPAGGPLLGFREWSHTGSHIPYATADYMRAHPDSRVTRMEKKAQEAQGAEDRGDSLKAYEIYREVLAMAPDDEMRRAVLQDIEMLCMNNPAVRERGPEVSRELEDLCLKKGDENEAAQTAAEQGDFLETLGRPEEARAEYDRALRAYPRSAWFQIRYARFLEGRGDPAGAKAAYRKALTLPDDDHAHETAEEELGQSE